MIGEIDGGFSWEGKNKVVNLFRHPVFGQGSQKGDIYLDFPPLLFAQTHLSYLFILLHPLPVKSQLENLTGNGQASPAILFSIAPLLCAV